MRRIPLFFSCSAVLWCATDLVGVRAVYVMPMSRGMDQFLANRLAGERLFHIVSDPRLADAVLTDRVGEALNASLDEFAPLAKPAAEASGDVDKDKKEKKDESPENKLDNPALQSTFGRGKGTFFLVDAKSRTVIWSTFEASRSSEASQLDRTASDIVSRLKRDLKKP